VSDNFDIDTV